MLTRLQFKNWRSLRDVTIEDLTPITVFIGANSSGKSNILDALHFVRYAENLSGSEAAFVWRVKEKVRTIGVKIGSPVEIELTYAVRDQNPAAHNPTSVVQKYTVEYSQDTPIVGSEKSWRGPLQPLEQEDKWLQQVSNFVSLRWQLLREGFVPPPTLASDTDPGSVDLYIIEPSARNVPSMLNFMQQLYPEVYKNLEADLQLLLGYVSQLGTLRDDKETRYFVEEKSALGHEAPTISGGTARIIAMLTAYYALDMPKEKQPDLAKQPGLVVIEEPDFAVHPLLFGNLIDLLRSYTEREGHPRQFILTTHNPQMLNYFEPHEVRIVERGDDGATTVKRVDEKVAEVWRQHDGAFNLGSLWTTRLIGGVPR